jgi:hypothetical protein
LRIPVYRERGRMPNNEILCPAGHGKMETKRCKKNIIFKNVNIDYSDHILVFLRILPI